MNHDYDAARIAQLMSEFDAVETEEQTAGLAADPQTIKAGRAFIVEGARYLFGRSRSLDETREVYEGLRMAVRARVNAPEASEQIRRLESEFVGRFRFTGTELDWLAASLQPHERIVEIRPRVVITDRREITRDSLIGQRVATFSEERWQDYVRMNFPSATTLAAVEADYEQEQQARAADLQRQFLNR